MLKDVPVVIVIFKAGAQFEQAQRFLGHQGKGKPSSETCNILFTASHVFPRVYINVTVENGTELRDSVDQVLLGGVNGTRFLWYKGIGKLGRDVTSSLCLGSSSILAVLGPDR